MESAQTTDVTKHLRLMPLPGEWGYSELKFFANHPYQKGDQLFPANKLVEKARSGVTV